MNQKILRFEQGNLLKGIGNQAGATRSAVQGQKPVPPKTVVHFDKNLPALDYK